MRVGTKRWYPAEIGLIAAVLACGPLGAQQAGRVRTGVVVDAHGGAALAGVSVRAAGSTAATDAAGRFRLAGVPDTAVVTFERLGYAVLHVRAAELSWPVRLSPAPILLNALTLTSQSGQRLAEASALAAQSVGREALDATGNVALAEALDGAEGVSVARLGSWGARPVVRGLQGERVAVLVDGERVNRACAFGMDQGLASVDPGTVQRVEILSGPGSALYGSGNIGGVINVVTRPGGSDAPLSGEVRGQASSSVPGGSVGATLRLDRGALDASLSFDGSSFADYRTPGGRVANSSFRQGTGDLKLGYDLEGAGRLALHAQDYEGQDIGWPSMADASIPVESRRSLSLDYGAQLGRGVLDGVAGRAYMQRLDHDMVVRMAMTSPAGMAMTSTTRQRSHSVTSGGRAQLRLRPSAGAQAEVGTEATLWQAENSRWTVQGNASNPLALHTWPGVDILDVGGFAQGELRSRAGVTVSAGFRLDHVGRSADGWPRTRQWIRSGNAGLRWSLPAALAARLGVGWGYRLPDPTELFGLALRPDGFLYVGNPELAAEHGRNVEVGVERDGGRLGASLTLFQNDLHGMIAALLAGDSVDGRPARTYGNLDRARLRGVSGSLRWTAAPRVRLAGSVSYTRGQDRSRGGPLPAMPPLQGSATLRLLAAEAATTWLELEGRGATRQSRYLAAAGEVATPAYGVLNARLGFPLERARVQLGIDNLLDRAYRGHLDPVSLLRPGRNVYLRVSRAFSMLNG